MDGPVNMDFRGWKWRIDEFPSVYLPFYFVREGTSRLLRPLNNLMQAPKCAADAVKASRVSSIRAGFCYSPTALGLFSAGGYRPGLNTPGGEYNNNYRTPRGQRHIHLFHMSTTSYPNTMLRCAVHLDSGYPCNWGIPAIGHRRTRLSCSLSQQLEDIFC